jgi:LacI family transcriptional regulator
LSRTNNIGLIIADISNNFYGEFAEGVLARAKAAGRHVIVCPTGEDSEAEREYVDVLLQQRVDGIIAFPTTGSTQVWEDVLRHGTSLVFVDRMIDELDVPAVLPDNVGGTKAAIEYLLALGHRRIAFLGGPQDLTSGRQREYGYREAMTEAGLTVDDDLVVRARFTRNNAHATALRLLHSPPAPTAIFASNNVLAEAAMAAIRDSGMRMPADISLMMFDDVPWARITSPPITVVAQPTRQMGDEAAQLVCAAQPHTGQRVRPVELIIRQSCKPIHI